MIQWVLEDIPTLFESNVDLVSYEVRKVNA